MHKDHNLIKHCEVSNNVSADMYTCRFTCEYMYTCVCVSGIIGYRLVAVNVNKSMMSAQNCSIH